MTGLSVGEQALIETSSFTPNIKLQDDLPLWIQNFDLLILKAANDFH
jgi:hypothetical protein